MLLRPVFHTPPWRARSPRTNIGRRHSTEAKPHSTATKNVVDLRHPIDTPCHNIGNPRSSSHLRTNKKHGHQILNWLGSSLGSSSLGLLIPLSSLRLQRLASSYDSSPRRPVSVRFGGPTSSTCPASSRDKDPDRFCADLRRSAVAGRRSPVGSRYGRSSPGFAGASRPWGVRAKVTTGTCGATLRTEQEATNVAPGHTTQEATS